jgi:hypothetical protein
MPHRRDRAAPAGGARATTLLPAWDRLRAAAGVDLITVAGPITVADMIAVTTAATVEAMAEATAGAMTGEMIAVTIGAMTAANTD